MSTEQRVRVLLCKIGLDGHDKGIKLLAAALRNAGLEVIYTGTWQTIDQVIHAAQQEDVDIIGVGSLAGDHLLVPRLMVRLKEAGLSNKPVIMGGIVPHDEVEKLLESGVAKVFHPGAQMQSIADFIKSRTARSELNEFAD